MYKLWQNRKEQIINLAQEAKALQQLCPPIEVLGEGDCAQTPVIFSSPHSGRIYPEDWVKQSCLPMNQLRQAEDAFVDEIFKDVTVLGAPLLSARFARSYVDVNRSVDECPAQWPSAGETQTPRAAAGLGVIPLVIGQGRPIYDARDMAALQSPEGAQIGKARLAALYHPYHAALARLIAEAKSAFGYALLIECHSMPGFGPMKKRRPDIILGDNFGSACAGNISAAIEHDLRTCGYSLVRNHPYAGGYITQKYGQPDQGVHVLQIEINRDLYLNPITLKTKTGFEPLRADMQSMAQKLIERHSRPLGNAIAHAAE